MADISMEYNSMESLATAVNDMKSDFDKLEQNLKSLVGKLEGQWQGAAQVEFAAAYEKLDPKISTISKMLENFADAVLDTSYSFQDTDNSATY